MPTHSPLTPQIEQFIHDNPQGVLTSFRRNGMPQLSIVTVYPRDGGVGISITETRMKFKNLLRDPRCSVLISHADWWSGFLVFEGKAELTHSGNTGSDALRLARRHIFSATTRRRSRDWDEYDRITEADWRLFPTLLRFDAVYFSLFKCNRQRIADYPNLNRYLHMLLRVPGVADTVNARYYVLGYYSNTSVNPTGIIPRGPPVDFAHATRRTAA